MPNGYSRSPKLLKGALVELSEPFLGPVPNIIVFQYNPETMTRELTPWSGDEWSGGRWEQKDPSAQPFDPGENLTLTLEFDAADDLEDPDSHPVAVVSGVAARPTNSAMLQLISPRTSAPCSAGSSANRRAIARLSAAQRPPRPTRWRRAGPRCGSDSCRSSSQVTQQFGPHTGDVSSAQRQHDIPLLYQSAQR